MVTVSTLLAGVSAYTAARFATSFALTLNAETNLETNSQLLEGIPPQRTQNRPSRDPTHPRHHGTVPKSTSGIEARGALTRLYRGLQSETLQTPQVFQHLHVIDMYHLSLTSRSLHDMLWHPSLYPLWKEAFARIPLFPSCPPALTQPQWAALMFGPVRCQVGATSLVRGLPERLIYGTIQDCGRFGAQPDVALYRNYCSPCTVRRPAPAFQNIYQWHYRRSDSSPSRIFSKCTKTNLTRKISTSESSPSARLAVDWVSLDFLLVLLLLKLFSPSQ